MANYSTTMMVRFHFLFLAAMLFLLGFAPAATAEREVTIAFLGDSLTAGYGLAPEQAYPALLEKTMQQANLSALIINGGISGDTTSSGRRRVAWLLKRPTDVLVIALGSNDGLRGLPIEQMRENLEATITTARARYPEIRIVLAGMKLPPNFGNEYTEAFHRMYSDLATKHQTALIPFLLEGVGGVPELNQADGIHPTAEGQRILAENVWKVLAPLLVEPDQKG